MTFDDIASGQLLFVDANTLVYHFAAEPVLGPPCQRLLDRIDRGDVQGFISTDVLSDVAHRLMTQEAIRRFGWPLAGIAQRLRSHPSHVQQLSDFRAAVDDHETMVRLDLLKTQTFKGADDLVHFGGRALFQSNCHVHGALAATHLELPIRRHLFRGLRQALSHIPSGPVQPLG